MKSNSIFSKIVIFLIVIYQKFLSPTLFRRLKCRFHPTCSEYAIIAIKKYGLFLGIKKSYHRLSKCRPDNLDTCIDLP